MLQSHFTSYFSNLISTGELFFKSCNYNVSSSISFISCNYQKFIYFHDIPWCALSSRTIDVCRRILDVSLISVSNSSTYWIQTLGIRWELRYIFSQLNWLLSWYEFIFIINDQSMCPTVLIFQCANDVNICFR